LRLHTLVSVLLRIFQGHSICSEQGAPSSGKYETAVRRERWGQTMTIYDRLEYKFMFIKLLEPVIPS